MDSWVGLKIKVAQNVLKHILVLEFRKYNEICPFLLLSTSKQRAKKINGTCLYFKHALRKWDGRAQIISHTKQSIGLLPPAYVVRREVMFSLCPLRPGSDGVPPWPGQNGVHPSQDWGTPSPPPRPGKDVVPPSRDRLRLDRLCRGRYASCGFPQKDCLVGNGIAPSDKLALKKSLHSLAKSRSSRKHRFNWSATKIMFTFAFFYRPRT